MDCQPFTYLIGWSEHDRWYIGARWADGCRPSDLWSTYFTSSKYVQSLRKSIGEPDVIEIDRVFCCKKDALDREVFLLTANRVKEKDCFINKAIGGRFDPSDPEIRRKSSDSHKGKKQSEETKKKKSESLKGRVISEEHRAKIAKSNTGKKWTENQRNKVIASLKSNKRRLGTKTSEEGRRNIALAKIGTKHSEETKIKMSEVRKGMKFNIVECPHCGKIGGESAMKRWHFSHCKFVKE